MNKRNCYFCRIDGHSAYVGIINVCPDCGAQNIVNLPIGGLGHNNSLYLCGPDTITPYYKKKYRVIKQSLTESGYLVMNPTQGMKSCVSWKKLMIHRITCMFKCTGVAYMLGQINFAGCKIELDLAEKLSIPVFSVRQWIKQPELLPEIHTKHKGAVESDISGGVIINDYCLVCKKEYKTTLWIDLSIDRIFQNSRNKLLYLCGPVSLNSEYRKYFKKMQILLLNAGYSIINPTLWLNSDVPWNVAMKECILQMTDCSGVAYFGKYEKSKECTIELDLAEQLSIPAFPVKKWIEITKDKTKLTPGMGIDSDKGFHCNRLEARSKKVVNPTNRS